MDVHDHEQEVQIFKESLVQWSLVFWYKLIHAGWPRRPFQEGEVCRATRLPGCPTKEALNPRGSSMLEEQQRQLRVEGGNPWIHSHVFDSHVTALATEGGAQFINILQELLAQV